MYTLDREWRARRIYRRRIWGRSVWNAYLMEECLSWALKYGPAGHTWARQVWWEACEENCPWQRNPPTDQSIYCQKTGKKFITMRAKLWQRRLREEKKACVRVIGESPRPYKRVWAVCHKDGVKPPRRYSKDPHWWDPKYWHLGFFKYQTLRMFK